GELLRAQVALAHPPGDLAELLALERREAELRARYEKKWLAPLKKWGVKERTVRRGLVEHVTLPAHKFLTHAEELLARFPVYWVGLPEARYVARHLSACPQLARLAALDLSGGGLDEIHLEAFLSSPHLSNLRRLNLAFNPLGVHGARALAAADGLGALTALGLDAAHLGDEGVQVLAAAPRPGGRAELSLARNGIGKEG